MKPWVRFPDSAGIKWSPQLNELEYQQNLFLDGFSKETSSDPDNWTPDDPTRGNCAVAALSAWDFYGGEILRASLEKVPGYEGMRSHYWNRLPSGLEVDFTADQFKGKARDLVPRGEVRTRKYLLENPKTKARYELLKSVLDSSLKSADSLEHLKDNSQLRASLFQSPEDSCNGQ